MNKKLRAAEGIHLAASYLIKATLLLAALITAIQGNWEAMLLSLLTLILTFVPAFVSRNYKLNLPSEFELVFVLFVFAGIFLGELGFYHKFWWWDIMLHTVSGMIMAFIGFLILYILHYQNRLRASPGLIVFLAFCFSLALGALWEMFEFGMDRIFGTTMMKPMFGDFSGLTDTMWDLIVNALGALVVSATGYLYLKGRQGGLFGELIKKFISRNRFKR